LQSTYFCKRKNWSFRQYFWWWIAGILYFLVFFYS